jgi:hypothetical protein
VRVATCQNYQNDQSVTKKGRVESYQDERDPSAYQGGEGMVGEQYYALCVEDEDGEPEIAFFELTTEVLPGALGISLYTAPDGELQRRHLQQGNDRVLIVAKSHEDLLEAMSAGLPSSVYLDGKRIEGSVFKAMLEVDLDIPHHPPRLIRLDVPDLG